MALSMTYDAIWEWVEVNGNELINFYWNDFNPTQPTIPTNWTTAEVSNQTSTFDLFWFQPWHEVWCGMWILENTWSSSVTVWVSWKFQRLRSGSWSTSWQCNWNVTIQANQKRMWYMYFWVDDDEIWDWYTSYRIQWVWASTWWDTGTRNTSFSVSNLNIDSWLYPSGCLWVDWAELCYTDWIYWSEWYIHHIAHDSDVYEYVGRDCAGSIWLEDSGATAMKRIYYVTENWYKTRTYWCQEWYWWNVNVGSSRKWSIRVPTWDMEDWYGHLCYVTATGQKLRVLNWPPY